MCVCVCVCIHTYIHTHKHTYMYIYICIYIYVSIYIYIYHTDTEGCVPRTSLELGHLWSYQTQHMCRRLANTHHTSCRTQTTPHTSERGSGISFTRPMPARSISLTTRHYLLLVKCSRHVICRLNSGTQTTPHTFEREAVASALAARDRRLRAASASRRATLF